jgi:hypothetical protein
MSSSKNLTCKGTLQQGVYLSEAQKPIPTPLTHCIREYSILIHTGKGGEGEEGGEYSTDHIAGLKIPT